MIKLSTIPHILFRQEINQSQITQNVPMGRAGISFVVILVLAVVIYGLYQIVTRRAEEPDLPNLDADLYASEDVDACVRREVLEEARRRFDDEIDRRNTLESKLGIVFALDGAIVALLGSTLQSPGTLPFKIAGAFAVVSAGMGLLALRQYNYQLPGDEDYYNDYIKDDASSAFPTIISNLNNTYENNKRINNERFQIYQAALYLTGVSLLAIIFGVVMSNL